jgi:outer membrane protein
MLSKRIPLLLSSLLVAGISIHSSAETLKDVYSLSLDNDPQLRADEYAYKAGKEALTIGRSYLLPQITAQAAYSDTEQTNSQPFITGQAPVQFETESQNSTYSATLTQPIFNMAAWFGYKQGKSLSQLAEAQFSAAQQNLIIRTSEAYFNVLRAIDNMTTAQSEEKALHHQLEQTRQRFEVGLTAITDVHEAQAAYDNATATTLGAKGQLGISFEELSALTGQSHDKVAPLVQAFPVNNPVPATREAWVEASLKNNYSLKTAKLNSKASKSNARSKASSHMPTITAQVIYTDMNDTNTVFSSSTGRFSNDARTFDGTTFGIQLDIPIFSGLRSSGERRQAYAQHGEAQEIYNKTQRDIIQGSRALHLSVVTGVAQVKARQQAITSSNSALEATQAGYEVGTRNLVDVLIAQRNLFNAKRNFDNTRYDYIINMLKLKEVAGNLTPEDILTLDKWLDIENQVKRTSF